MHGVKVSKTGRSVQTGDYTARQYKAYTTLVILNREEWVKCYHPPHPQVGLTCPGQLNTHFSLGVVVYASTDFCVTSFKLWIMVTWTWSSHFSTMPCACERGEGRGGRGRGKGRGGGGEGEGGKGEGEGRIDRKDEGV